MPSYSGVWTLPAQYQARGQNLWPVIITGSVGYVFSTDSGTDSIQYFNIPSGGTTTTYGGRFYSSGSMYQAGALSNSIYGLQASFNSPYSSSLAYIVLSSLGAAGSWGSLTQTFTLSSTCANSTRGIVGASATGSPTYNAINYITWATQSNATYFGDISGTTGQQQGAALSSSTRGCFAIGYNSDAGAPTYALSLIAYITIATTGNTSTFGDLSLARRYMGATSSSTRGLYMGGYNNSVLDTNRIDYITIASTGNATTFGELTVARRTSSTSDSVKAVACGGVTSGGNTNVIDYVTIATTGNATNYGTLSVFGAGAACSNCHGGL